MTLIDTHRHQFLHSSLYSFQSIIVSTCPQDWQTTLELSQNMPNHYPALGIHPWFVTKTSAQDIAKLTKLLESNQVIAIGEVGLDKYGQYATSLQSQRIIFEKMLDLAELFELPLSIHCRKAYNELYNHLQNRALNGVLHGFSGSYEQAMEFIKLGYKIGVNGLVCHTKATKYRAVIERLSLDDIVIETDYPNVVDQNKVSIELDQVLDCLAKLKDCPIETLAEITTHNAKEIFRI